jgi:hypothetical protein
MIFLSGGYGGIVLDFLYFYYRNGFILVPEDSTLSVCGRGTPNAHSFGWGMGGVKSGSKTNKVIAKDNC